MTLKVVGASPIIYLILEVNFSPKILRNIKEYGRINKNPTFASAWAYEGLLPPSRFMKIHCTISNVVLIFTKRRNHNKLYMSASTGLFLSPGIILRSYSDPEAKHLKKKQKAWAYSMQALKRVTRRPWVAEFRDLYGKKEYVLKKIISYKIPISWLFFRVAYRVDNKELKPRRRIKKWVKKKYFRLGSLAN